MLCRLLTLRYLIHAPPSREIFLEWQYLGRPRPLDRAEFSSMPQRVPCFSVSLYKQHHRYLYTHKSVDSGFERREYGFITFSNLFESLIIVHGHDGCMDVSLKEWERGMGRRVDLWVVPLGGLTWRTGFFSFAGGGCCGFQLRSCLFVERWLVHRWLPQLASHFRY